MLIILTWKTSLNIEFARSWEILRVTTGMQRESEPFNSRLAFFNGVLGMDHIMCLNLIPQYVV